MMPVAPPIRTYVRMGNRSVGRTIIVPVPGVFSTPDKKIQVMNGQQLEISFDQSIPLRRVARYQRRIARAQWWFAQMRQVVDRAWEREPAQPARPDQAVMPWTPVQESK